MLFSRAWWTPLVFISVVVVVLLCGTVLRFGFGSLGFSIAEFFAICTLVFLYISRETRVSTLLTWAYSALRRLVEQPEPKQPAPAAAGGMPPHCEWGELLRRRTYWTKQRKFVLLDAEQMWLTFSWRQARGVSGGAVKCHNAYGLESVIEAASGGDEVLGSSSWKLISLDSHACDVHKHLESAELLQQFLDGHVRPQRSLLVNDTNLLVARQTRLQTPGANSRVPPHRWAISRIQMIQFLNECAKTQTWQQLCDEARREGEVLNLHQVNKHLVKPCTEGTGCGVALLLNKEPLEPTVMISHGWCGDIEQVRRVLVSGSGRKLLKDQVLWFCMLALYQNGEQGVGPSIEWQLNQNPFKECINMVELMCVIHTTTSDVYSRLWCCFEMASAEIKGTVDTEHLHSGELMDSLRREEKTERVNTADCYAGICTCISCASLVTAACSYLLRLITDEELLLRVWRCMLPVVIGFWTWYLLIRALQSQAIPKTNTSEAKCSEDDERRIHDQLQLMWPDQALKCTFRQLDQMIYGQREKEMHAALGVGYEIYHLPVLNWAMKPADVIPLFAVILTVKMLLWALVQHLTPAPPQLAFESWWRSMWGLFLAIIMLGSAAYGMIAVADDKFEERRMINACDDEDVYTAYHMNDHSR